MFLRILCESFRRGAPSKTMVGGAILLGAALITALWSFTLDVGDKIGRELRRLGANLSITPAGEGLPVRVGEFLYSPLSQDAFIAEDDLKRLKEMFWRNNILALTPYLTIPVQLADGVSVPLVGTWYQKSLRLNNGQIYSTGMRSLSTWWTVTGQWIEDQDEEGALLGEDLASRYKLRLGDSITVRYGDGTEVRQKSLVIRGLLRSGGEEDKQILVALPLVQKLTGLSGKVRRVQVSALTKPDDALALKDPKRMTPKEYDLWYCSPYVSSIAHQLKEVLPNIEVKPIRQVVEAEGAILKKVELMILLITLATLLSMALAVSSTTSTTILQRRTEIALMKAIGASHANVMGIFLVEAALLGLLGGLLGFGFGALTAQVLGRTIFGATITLNLLLLPVIVTVSGAIALLGCLLPLRAGLQTDPGRALHES